MESSMKVFPKDYDLRLTITDEGGIMVTSSEEISAMELYTLFTVFARHFEAVMTEWVNR